MNRELQEASERWKKEGQEYKKAVNEWLDIIYINKENPITVYTEETEKDMSSSIISDEEWLEYVYSIKENPTTDCPEETREDMASYILAELIKHNKEGRHKEFRDLFPPDNDPLSDFFLDDNMWNQVCKVAILEDQRIIAKIGHYYQWQGVYLINGDDITLIDDLMGFGFSHDKKYFAKVYNNRIDIYKGWDGDYTLTLPLPDNISLKELQYDSLEVFSTGRQVILATHHGIFLIDANGYELISTKIRDEDEDEDETVHYTNLEPNCEQDNERPTIVPAEAVWNSNLNEWELGKKNEAGNNIGEWKWWLAPIGYLCCHTFYEGEDGNIFTFTRFHPDGTPSRIGKYANGQLVGEDIRIRSDNPTTELFSTLANNNVWKTVTTVKYGYTIEEHYYDKYDNEVQQAYISNTEIPALQKKTGIVKRLYIEKDWKHLFTAAIDVIESDEAAGNGKEIIKANYYKLYALYQLNNKIINDEQLKAADVILGLFNFTLSSDLDARIAIRFAYYVKAQSEIDLEDYAESWKHLKKAFDIVLWPADNKIEMMPYKAMKLFLASKTDINVMEKEKHQYGEFLRFPHAAISPDDKYIALGSGNTKHFVLVQKNGRWEQTAVIEPRSFYPNIACFNGNWSEPMLALGSFNYTLLVSVDHLEGLQVSGNEINSDSLFLLDDKKWICSIYPSKDGFFLGTTGDVWLKSTNNTSHYIHIGGNILSIDGTNDGKYLVVGTASGQIVLLRKEIVQFQRGKNPRIDRYLITNMPVIDEKRYVFMNGVEPMIW